MASLLREQTRVKESLEGALERQKEGILFTLSCAPKFDVHACYACYTFSQYWLTYYKKQFFEGPILLLSLVGLKIVSLAGTIY